MTNRRRWSTLHFTMRMLHYLESFCMMSQKKPLYWSLQALGKIGGLYFSLQVLQSSRSDLLHISGVVVTQVFALLISYQDCDISEHPVNPAHSKHHT